MTSIDQMLEAAAERGAERALLTREVAPPAPHPIGVSVAEAARLLSVGEDKVRSLLKAGRIRRLDLGDNDTPGSRVVIATLSLLELDPGATPDRLATVLRLDVDRDDAA